jgi:hypothetical protein
MQVVSVRKAQPITSREEDEVPDLAIYIGHHGGTIPRDEPPNGTIAVFECEAKLLAKALHDTLPGGTFDRLTAELLLIKASQFRVPYDKLLNTSGPERIDLSGRYDSRTDAIRYLGYATRQPDGRYRVLADVNGSLCIVEVTLHFEASSVVPATVADSPNVIASSESPEKIRP